MKFLDTLKMFSPLTGVRNYFDTILAYTRDLSISNSSSTYDISLSVDYLNM